MGVYPLAVKSARVCLDVYMVVQISERRVVYRKKSPRRKKLVSRREKILTFSLCPPCTQLLWLVVKDSIHFAEAGTYKAM